MTRPRKPSMTPEEAALCVGISQDKAAARISENRGGARDPRARVSQNWVSRELRRLNQNPVESKPKSGLTMTGDAVLNQNSDFTAYPVSRIAPGENSDDSIRPQEAPTEATGADLENGSRPEAAK